MTDYPTSVLLDRLRELAVATAAVVLIGPVVVWLGVLVGVVDLVDRAEEWRSS